jgi:probable HAF family extracellular repeat protein
MRRRYLTSIDDPVGNGTSASGIHNAGQIVGYFVDGDDHEHGFLLSGHPYQ